MSSAVDHLLHPGYIQDERVCSRAALMAVFEGVIVLHIKPWTRIPVTITFDKGHMLIRGSDGERLASPAVTRVRIDQTGNSRIQMRLLGDEVTLEIEEADALVHAYEIEMHKRMEQPLWKRGIEKLTAHAPTLFPNATPTTKHGASQPDYDLTDGTHPSVAVSDVTEAENQSEPSMSPRLVQAREDTIAALREAAERWFGFYFILEEGTDLDRLNRAAKGLQSSAGQLRDIAENLEGIPGLNSASDERFEIYRSAVLRWAEALDTIATGVVLDQQKVADQGFGHMAEGSAIAEQIVNTQEAVAGGSTLAECLAYLSNLKPPADVPAKSVEKAKQPWRRALIAAGAPVA